MNSRTMIENFMNLSKQVKLTPEIKQKIDTFLRGFSKRDLRKKSSKLRLWNFLEQLREYEPIKDAIDGMMADLAERWGQTLGKALRDHKIS